MTDKMKEITKKLEEGVQAVFDSENFKNYLSTMSKFHNYSVNNSMLIFCQCKNASLVAGFRKWQSDFKRTVKKGEKAIWILAPVPHKATKVNKDGEEEEYIWNSFRPVPVFDISQTEGEDLPAYEVKDLEGDVERYEEIMSKLEEIAPVPMRFDAIEGGAHGFYSPANDEIVIRENMSRAQTVKTAIHEVAHSMLHKHSLLSSNDKEIQAEATAYIVSQHLGLDTGDYSFAYIAGWSKGKTVKDVTAQLEVIRKTANQIINALGV